MKLEYQGNTTKAGFVNLIWAFGEATGVMMVFAAPGIPKAFSSQTFLGGVISTIRSWTRLGDGTTQRSGGSDPPVGGPRPPTIGGGGGGKTLRKPPSTELDLMETRNSDNIELGLGPGGGAQEGHIQQNRIVKTTFLETQEDSASKSSTERIMGRQHPWMDERRW